MHIQSITFGFKQHNVQPQTKQRCWWTNYSLY